jgi:hypothetical protein
MSSSSKRSCAPVATAPPAGPSPRKVPSLVQLCLNELLTEDGDLARYLQQDSLRAQGKLETTNVTYPPDLYRECNDVLERLYAQRPLLFQHPEYLGSYCQHPRCLAYGQKEIGLHVPPFLPRYLHESGSGRLIWVCHPDQPYSTCQWDSIDRWYARKPVVPELKPSEERASVRRGLTATKFVVWDLEGPSGI